MVQHRADVPPAPARLDSIDVQFNDPGLISDAGLLLCATLAERLGIEELVNESVWLGHGVPGASLPSRKVMTLIHGMLAGGDSIDDMNVLRAGATQAVLGHRVMAPSTLGTFLRAFTFGHVRQLDHVLDVAVSRAWGAGVGPGELLLVLDMDSFVGEVYGYAKDGAGYGYTHKLGYHPCAWTVIAAIAHNIARWTTLSGAPNQPVQTARSRRDQLLRVPGRIVRTARRWTLRLPARWPRQTAYLTCLTQIRAIPIRT